jgi:hypothetical protein
MSYFKIYASVCALAVVTSFSAHAAGAGNTGGGCYNLQLIAQKTKSVSASDNNGHRIFLGMRADGSVNTKIKLAEGSFGVVDYNGTDGEASFRLPNPDPMNTGTPSYKVWARMVGKPGAGVDISTCAYDSTGVLYCSEDTLSMQRVIGRSNFTDVSKQLLYITADLDGDGDLESVNIFNEALQDYFWSVDSFGRAHAQLRFCPK